MNLNSWKGNPYHPISAHYEKLFGEKVYKIPVTTVDDCPNRRGLKGMETCIFCDVWGSAAQSESINMSLKSQIDKYKVLIGKKFNAKKFLVYFQAYTNSFEKIDVLRKQFEQCLEYEDIIGFVVGTRPDCISPALFRLWQEFHEKRFVSIELGVQSFSNEHLEFMKRGHTAEQSYKAIQKIRDNTSVELGIHLMFGWPNETLDEVAEAANACNVLNVDSVKLHNLHVLDKTPLADLFFAEKFNPIDRETYAKMVMHFVERLNPNIPIHRLAAYASRQEELIAPEWTASKKQTHQFIVETFLNENTYQGRLYTPSVVPVTTLTQAINNEMKGSFYGN